jgi:hypothetical protein
MNATTTPHTITLLDVGRSEIPGPELFWMKDFGEWYDLCFQVAVIRGGGATVLLNTGPALDLEPMNAGWRTFLGERAGMKRQPGKYILEQLSRIGIAPEEVTHVILSPLQLYTISNLNEFPNAEICISKRGWEHFHNGPAVLHDTRNTSIPDDILVPLVTTERGRLRLLHRNDTVVPGVRTWWSGVHHRASMVVEVDTTSGVVALSDSFFWIENIEQNQPIGICEDIWEALETYDRVRNTADVIVPLYDPKNFERFPNGIIQ